jgi:hypothetical protein
MAVTALLRSLKDDDPFSGTDENVSSGVVLSPVAESVDFKARIGLTGEILGYGPEVVTDEVHGGGGPAVGGPSKVGFIP